MASHVWIFLFFLFLAFVRGVWFRNKRGVETTGKSAAGEDEAGGTESGHGEFVLEGFFCGIIRLLLLHLDPHCLCKTLIGGAAARCSSSVQTKRRGCPARTRGEWMAFQHCTEWAGGWWIGHLVVVVAGALYFVSPLN